VWEETEERAKGPREWMENLSVGVGGIRRKSQRPGMWGGGGSSQESKRDCVREKWLEYKVVFKVYFLNATLVLWSLFLSLPLSVPFPPLSLPPPPSVSPLPLSSFTFFLFSRFYFLSKSLYFLNKDHK
jgi:hypothetical protein